MADREAIKRKITGILGRIVDDEDLKLEDSTIAEDVDNWDSINHVKLVIALERNYDIRFEPDEISTPENVGQLIDLIASHVDAKTG